jgi:thiamine-monophosphate kinase
MDEFELIDAVVRALGSATSGPGIVLGPGDDCAVAALPPDTELVTSIDTLVSGVHFPADAPGEAVGHRALGVTVSDLAAMGATPLHAVVSIALEPHQQHWLLDFARGMGDAARAMGIAVVGGNLARGPLNVAVSVHGFVPRGQALRRSGAHAGDRIYVSGVIGAAGLALDRLGGPPPPLTQLTGARPGEADYPLARYWLPTPRTILGISLRHVASAAIDISDGLLADLGHVCAASGVGARVAAERLPLAPGSTLESAVTAGDDYELLFTVPPSGLGELEELAADVTEIGEIVPDRGVTLLRGGQAVDFARTGFRHFS